MSRRTTGENSGKSTLVVKLVIRGENFELSTEGLLSELSKETSSIITFRDQLASKLAGVKGSSPITDKELSKLRKTKISADESLTTQIATADVPVISPSKSTIKNITALFSTSWGKSPRTVGEVLKALELNAASDRPQAVSRDLIRLTRRVILRRVPKEGSWTYFRVPGEK